mmetsp:Transcript_12525/g.29346  ORF Transcript_12525/g.29346 Transcript_12525/m.29346 type:complete len:505 (+) Transcript_12525:173-1687(+)
MRSFRLLVAILAGSLTLSARRYVVTGFGQQGLSPQTRNSGAGTITSSSSTQLFLGPPKINEWEILRSGAVRGTVSNHPDLPDGYEITTSPLETSPTAIKDNVVVVTLSGSKYRLLKALPGKQPTPKQQPKQQQPAQRSTMSLFGGSQPQPAKANNAKKETKPAPVKAKAKPKPKPAPSKPAAAKKPAPAQVNYNLNGKVVGGTGNTRYLLVGNQIRSSSKRSQIFYAYEADADGNPQGNRLTVKLANNQERLRGESKIYDRVFSKGRVAFSLQGSGSCFVRKVAFIVSADASPATKGISRGSSALVLESGDQNLRTYASESRGGLTGSDLRKAAVGVCRCVEAMHSSGLVWTDLKAENFVLFGDGEVRGIDLESAVAVRSSPEDYSPEACPPEFAALETANRGYEFECLKNYDSWSLGMLLYELSTGSNYFKGKSEDSITRILAAKDLLDESSGKVAGLDAIPDKNMRDLVGQCLSIDPNKRPSIGQILLHPYFLTTGFGPLTF